MTEIEYYKKIALSRTSVTLAGLGYDSFRLVGIWVSLLNILVFCGFYCLIYLHNMGFMYRLWETLTFGTVPVIEKGTGLDKPVSSYLYVNDTIMYCTLKHCTVLFFSL